MELGLFNVENGYLEAILRSLRLSFLDAPQYSQLKNITNLAQLRSHLEEDTDYGTYFQTEQQDVSVQTIKNCLNLKLADDLEYIEKNSIHPLSTFLFFVRTSFMIDNMVNLVQGIKTKTSIERLEANVNPIGLFPELKTIKVEGEDLSLLYESVLIDTPISKYFLKYIEMNMEDATDMEQLKGFFKEINFENLRANLKRLWLQDFHEFVQGLNGISKENMNRLLEFEADTKAVQVVYNSFDQAKAKREGLRKKLCPSFGKLYPDCHELLIKAENLHQLKEAALSSNVMTIILDRAPDPQQMDGGEEEAKTLEDLIFEQEVELNSLVFDEQCNFAAFYSFVKLRQQEIRNIIWIAEMIARNVSKDDRVWNKIIVPFADKE